jgi:hypothetical protein
MLEPCVDESSAKKSGNDPSQCPEPASKIGSKDKGSSRGECHAIRNTLELRCLVVTAVMLRPTCRGCVFLAFVLVVGMKSDVDEVGRERERRKGSLAPSPFFSLQLESRDLS